jgi:hypothetical protein
MIEKTAGQPPAINLSMIFAPPSEFHRFFCFPTMRPTTRVTFESSHRLSRFLGLRHCPCHAGQTFRTTPITDRRAPLYPDEEHDFRYPIKEETDRRKSPCPHRFRQRPCVGPVPPETLVFRSTEDLESLEEIVAHDRVVQAIMLREDVVEAARQGQFHVYPLRTIDEGIALLTGVPAGEIGPDGTYPEGTGNFLVQRRLKELAEQAKSFRGNGEPSGSPPTETNPGQNCSRQISLETPLRLGRRVRHLRTDTRTLLPLLPHSC